MEGGSPGAARDAPHWAQNRASGGITAPHFEHSRGRAAPHELQKRLPSGLSPSQVWQRTGLLRPPRTLPLPRASEVSLPLSDPSTQERGIGQRASERHVGRSESSQPDRS